MNNYKQTAAVFKALSDENRLHILTSLQEGEKCACTLLEEVKIAQSTLSHHMKILLESTLVNSRKEGKWTYYSLSDKGIGMAKASLADVLKKSVDYKTYFVC
ncbi:metalloregulator ArsR/SmtB family transcription factor [Vallitaleaceae bacterium 9-2]